MGKTHRKSKSWDDDGYFEESNRDRKNKKLHDRRQQAKLKHVMRDQDHDVLTREENY